jgi:polar amino acid transport system substrate-binding protein
MENGTLKMKNQTPEFSRQSQQGHYSSGFQNSFKRFFMIFLSRTALSILLAMALPAGAIAQSLLMVFRDKPPYSFIDNGVAKGFLLERTRRVLSLAGIEAEFREMPPKRIFFEIEKNEQMICSFGWYKIPEREKYARFSAPIHQDKPHIVLAGPQSASVVRKHGTLAALMSDPALTMAGAGGVSYGPELDPIISKFAGKVDLSLQSPLQVVKKIAAKRADFMFIDQEDFNYLTESSVDFRNDGLVRIDYPDMPEGLKRYILCSQRVNENTMQKINAAIGKVSG